MHLRKQESRAERFLPVALDSCLHRWAALALVALLAADPAAAQITAEAAITTDYRLRGYSITQREPAASLTLGYDDKSGFFTDGTGIVLRKPDGKIAFMGGFATIGYAKRLNGQFSVDVGLLRAQYTRHSGYRRIASYTELFAGLTAKSVSVRASFSPDYLWDGTSALHLSADLVRRPADKWRIVAHAGLQHFISGGPPYPAPDTQYDWGLRVARQIGHADLELAYSNGGPNREMIAGMWHPKSALTGTMRWAF